MYQIIKRQTISGNDTHFIVKKRRKFLWLFPYWDTITEKMSDNEGGVCDKRFTSEEAVKRYITSQNTPSKSCVETLVYEIS